MKRRIPIMALVAALCATVVVSIPVPAAAVVRTADWYRTKAVADYDSRSSVVAAAYGALVSTNVDAAVARFIARDFAFAKLRAGLNEARNTDFCRRVLATHTVEFAPEVHAAAQYALNSQYPADREAFARTGYAQAKARDRQFREATGEQAAALEQFDRDFVARLRDTDPGEQVRASAAYALRPAATDADLVEFFAHDWADSADLDLVAFRIRVTDEDMRWRAKVAGLLAAAQAAEQAALESADEADRATAAHAWAQLTTQTGTPRVVWADAQRVAEEQAAAWHRVVQAAGSTTGVNWQVITGSAGATAESWAFEREQAAEQAAYWIDLYAQALAGETRMAPGGAA
ncbi:hypothetical protein [Actinoplanes sp. NBRC 103695]|uniref:hypothetical protein n=1 Tax=Actinoplanes sp. NBRC 103695 TaxID=3032202 RepID=UPI0024A40D05|nr:hypothetical protein [Actinoplanes sp. NBRC 103695]GLY99908.1 hypothetical protein Acsp02_71610 [Actinoplanes sp. NBRC 103695]